MNGQFYTQNTIHIKVLERPHDDGRFYIRDKYLKEAKQTGKKMVIEYEGKKYVCTYREWMKGAKKMSKVFLIPDQPMILYGNYLARFEKKEEEKIDIFNMMVKMPDHYKLQIKSYLGLR